ncbi:MAG TPA: tannase/feruloyl esterase family alpha/beta hydrolase, partial [Steroidobacteraceae bacterium]|nr:tannase/feruloyl esterase family alpha/beta hydrolase [Steroidobacteraceae bacterium]
RYYGQPARFNYWNGCSTGGRQGYLLAQELGNELDGVMANAPAIYWTRFQTAQMWGQMAMRQLVGSPIIPAKLQQVRESAIAACDAADGVTDGIIQDPRACHFSAQANVCGTPTAPRSNCLTADEAAAVDKIWAGPRNAQRSMIWYGLDRGTDFATMDGPRPFALGLTQLHWDMHDRNFDWQSVSLDEYAVVAEQGSRAIADLTDTTGPLDTFRRHGGKLLTFVGTNDQSIFPRGVIGYYRQMAVRYGMRGSSDFSSIQDFYRLFLAPGVGHCGGGVGPAPTDPFNALVNWVEHGVAPATLLAAGGSAAPPTGRTRPLCPYPSKAIYNGSGSIDDAASFHCGDSPGEPSLVCQDVPVRYKHEKKGAPDYQAVGLSAGFCRTAHLTEQR